MTAPAPPPSPLPAPSPAGADAPLLALRGLRRLHVGPVDLDLAPGSCTTVMGSSGTGKSLLLRMVADLDPHDGDALLAGQACSGMPAPQWRRQVAYVAADAGWWADEVAAHFPPGYDFARWLPALGMRAEAAHWPVSRLSTGERQRLALLRAMQGSARVLLLDEPTSGLDATSTARVEALLQRHVDDGGALMLVTHQREQALRLGQRHFVLADGRLQEHAP